MKIRFQRKYLCIPYFLFLILFIILPILFIIYYAFTDGNGNFTWDALIDFFTNTNKLNVLLMSLMFSMLNTIVCLLIGYPIAYILSNLNMNVIDAGIAVLNMHAPLEVVSKVDLYEAYLAYKAFLLNA